MKTFICLAALMVCAYAQVSVRPGHPQPYPFAKLDRNTRDVKDLPGNKKVGEDGRIFGSIGGRIFGRIGQDSSGLYGKAGYTHQIFDDHRGKMNAEAYGSRVLGPYGDSTNFGGKLNWADQNAKASVDVSRPIGGHTGLKATGEGLWNLNKNTQVSAGGFYEQPNLGHGRPDYGVVAEIKHDI